MADVTTTFAAKDESFARTVDHLQNRLAGFQGSVGTFTKAAGGIASSFMAFAGPLAAMAAGFMGARAASDAFFEAVNKGGELAELSLRTGETAGNLAVLQRAFENAGMSADQVGTSINRMQRFIVEAANGGKSQIAVFDSLGLSYQNLAGLTPTDQMTTLARAISGVPDPARPAASAMEVFGKNGGELLPILSNMDAELGNARSQLGSYPAAVDKAAVALDGISDAFKSVSSKAQEFITGALAELAPGIEDFLESVASADFTAWGQKLGEALGFAFDLFKGLWQNPSEIFSLAKDYMVAMARLMGDSLVSAFQTAVEFFKNFFVAAWSGGVLEKMGEALKAAFDYSVKGFTAAMFNGFVTVMDLFENLWWNVTSDGTKSFAGQLLNVAISFAKDFSTALTNPALFIAEALASNLAKVTKDTSEQYRKDYDSSTWMWIYSVQDGLNKAADDAKTNLGAAGSAFGESIATAATTAADQTGIVKSNLFGGEEAFNQVKDHATKIAESAKTTRLEGEGFSAVMQTAKVNATAAARVIIGLSEGMDKASKNVNDAIDKMRGAWADGLLSEKDRIAMRDAEEKVRSAERDKQRAEDRADWLEKAGAEKAAYELRMKANADFKQKMEEIQKTLPSELAGGGASAKSAMVSGGKAVETALKAVVSPSSEERGKYDAPATEDTLEKVRQLLDDLNTKLPQNALT